MKQSEFLYELKENLVSRVSPEELEDILSDYESFFVSGREEGKSDDEISKELGSPAFLAKLLLGEQGSNKINQPDKRIASPGRRLCAYVMDALIAIVPAMILVLITSRNLALPIVLFLTYPSPVAGATMYMGYSAFTELSVHTESGIIKTYVSGPGETIDSITSASEQYPETAEYSPSDGRKPGLATRILAIAGLLFYLIYSLICALLLKGQTLGKKLMHIGIRRSNIGPVTNGAVFYREFLGKTLINTIPIIPIISLITILLTKDHKALHDMLADTIVVDV